jgi:uncharacterized phage-like protein YoqJ
VIVAATGHRPDKLGGYGRGAQLRLITLALQYLTEHPDITDAISGMALGWDTAWTIAALKKGIRVHAAIPFAGQHCAWPESSQRLYRLLLEQCSQVTYVSSPGYSCDKLQRRNRWMTDHCDRFVAVWNGSAGGTRNCIRYAQAVGRPVDNLWGAWAHSTFDHK